MRSLWIIVLLVSCSELPRENGSFVKGQKHYVGPAREDLNQDERCRGSLESFQPEGGMVPTPQLAEQIARTYLSSLYGSHFRRNEDRLETRLDRGVWSVSTILPEDSAGGNFEIAICRANGRVLGYSASQ